MDDTSTCGASLPIHVVLTETSTDIPPLANLVFVSIRIQSDTKQRQNPRQPLKFGPFARLVPFLIFIILDVGGGVRVENGLTNAKGGAKHKRMFVPCLYFFYEMQSSEGERKTRKAVLFVRVSWRVVQHRRVLQ